MSQQARTVSLAVGLFIAASSGAWSQMPPPPPPGVGAGIMMVRAGPMKCIPPGQEAGERASAGRMESEKLNAPYSGVGLTEVVQTLADGNRIVRKNTMRYFRDSSGRTRTEFEVAAFGPVVLGEKRTVVTINDPVANARYVLHPEGKRADSFKAAAVGKAGPGHKKQFVITKRGDPAGAGAGDVVFFSAAAPAGAAVVAEAHDARMKSMPAPVSLGERTVEGLKTVGCRLEFSVPAGEFGNELPMAIRSEQWFSPDLGVVVSSTHSDPMSGETTYRLTQVVRSEPDAALFRVPADYTVNELSGPQDEIALTTVEEPPRPQKGR